MSAISSIALSGLNSATLRVSNAASNIANATSSSALPASGGTYTGFQPQDVVSISSGSGGAGSGVASTLQARTPSYVAAADPSSPNANSDGIVAAPNVDPGAELISASTAQFAYNANAAVIKTADQMQKSLLNIIS